ncbi:MAG: PLP-dependent aspartate aminotransferase family protein [Pyrinomonadaceae bacterium]|nr:PLP-dependent aspartate aminotransferase family protein [Pyrinomonadaceae bacterium]MCX7639955.1 PLP-dependent aspartate aminotransferase family protein [Pyrinomonadaceae bacterium]MDW8304127.1 PLP-dependent aspartate aminotransferase family protein [Acidobacteriota bacterium]
MKKEKSFYTKAVHVGRDLENHYGALNIPIYNSSVFAFTDVEQAAAIHSYKEEGYFYGRLGNPTQKALEKAVAELEEGEDAVALASGMAAISACVLTFLKAGDCIVAPFSMYSTTTLLFKELNRFGIKVKFIDSVDVESYSSAVCKDTKLFWIETPSNPLLRITDLSAVAEIANSKGIITVADNTFATSFNQKPLNFGVDLVVHSATKYLGGHSDLSAGLIVGKKEFIEDIRRKALRLYGGSIAPQVAWLVLRGIKTLALRMERHNYNASVIANMLSRHKKVRKVYYPGLTSHEGHNIAKKQMQGFGGMVSFDVGSFEAGKKLVNSLKLCILGTSLGGVETLIQHSASMTHGSLSEEERSKAGVTDGLIRLSVGIEDVNDIIADLEEAFSVC